MKCHEENCDENHHSMFCSKRSKTATNNESSKKDEEKPSTSFHQEASVNIHVDSDEEVRTSYFNKELNKPATSSIILGVVSILYQNQQLNFLLDSGSTISLIESSVANKLKIKGYHEAFTMGWTNDVVRTEQTSRIIKIESKHIISNKNLPPLYFRTVKNLHLRKQIVISDDLKRKFQNIKNSNIVDYDQVHGLIGIDNICCFYFPETLKSDKEDEPIVIKTPLGDMVMRQCLQLKSIYDSYVYNTASNNNNFHHVYRASHELNDDEKAEMDVMSNSALSLIKDLNIENDRESFESVVALKMLDENVKKLPNNEGYQAPLLWKDPNETLPTLESKKVALRRYLILEKSFDKSVPYQECKEQVQNLLNKGYCKELTEDEKSNFQTKSFFLPIFFINQKKRVRMIWDAAAKVGGKSLNDYLQNGPNLYNDITKVMGQMREKKYLIVGDVQDMFHRITLTESDSECTRFLFRFDNESTIREFKMNVLCFGLKSAPTISQYCRNKAAEEFQDKYPKASHIVINNSYVDDVVTSLDTADECVNVLLNIREIFLNGNFNFIKINCNDKNVLTSFQAKLKDSDKIEKLISSERVSKILGYIVDFDNDEISINFEEENFSFEKYTKRNLLKGLMSLYDPLGLFEFAKVDLKLIYRKIASGEFDWDNEVPSDVKNEWIKTITRIKEIKNIKIPRKYCNNDYESCELHIFGDAGADMIGVVAYATFKNSHDEIMSIKLLRAKSFTVPLKSKRTIPEKELEAARQAVFLSEIIKKEHSINFDITYFYTDSTSTFYKILNDKKGTVYEENRLKILRQEPKENWRWINTDLMVADMITKVNRKCKFNYDNDWYIPPVLTMSNISFLPENFESKVEFVNFHHIKRTYDKVEIDFKNVSTLIRAINFFQYILRWRELTKGPILSLKKEIEELKKSRGTKSTIKKLKDFEDKYNLLRSEIFSKDFQYDKAENLMIKFIQNNHLHDEISLISQKKTLSKNHVLYKFSPFIDTNGILRITTRLSDDEENLRHFTYDQINPIILPRGSKITELYVMHHHLTNKHLFHKNTIALIKQRFHISHMYTYVKKTIKENCYYCLIRKTRPKAPMMGDLPKERICAYEPPFSYCMYDLAGPFKTKTSRNVTAERYVLVYSCLTTRGIHLELIEDLSANSTLNALQCIVNLRGKPSIIYSDNGTNFVAAKNNLNKFHEKWNSSLLEKGYICKPIEFKFGPARASHFQGSVERMVGLMKNVIKSITDMTKDLKFNMTDFTMRNILAEVTGLLNNRPLCLEGDSFITPNSFLIGRNNFQNSIICEDFKNNISLNNNYNEMRKFTARLWQDWLKYYLPSILKREKWCDFVTPLEIGDIVMTLDTKVTDSYRLGVVIDVNKGSKDQVRSVTIKLGKNDLMNIGNRKEILEKYKSESHSVVTRAAHSVAKIKLN